tara:strand:- start:641 stop:1657 length:1017 start_codon:yes stop_codon:yes gene_type:complete
MANVLLMFSGGANSAYALWKWLKETDHNITAVRGDESGKLGTQINDEEADCALAIVNWCKENIRDFTYETMEWPVDYEMDMGPLRPGFKAQYNFGALKPRYHGYAQACKDKKPDILVLGNSLENTSVASYPKFRSVIENPDIDVFFAGSPDITKPIPQGDDYDYHEVAKDQIGKCEQIAALPDKLVELSRNCKSDHDPEDIWCIPCAIWNAIQKWLADGKDPKEFDRYCAEKGHYGPYLDQADPETAAWRSGDCCDDCNFYNYLADLAGKEWPRVIQVRRDIAWFGANGADMTGVTYDNYSKWMSDTRAKVFEMGENPDLDGRTEDEYRQVMLAGALS